MNCKTPEDFLRITNVSRETLDKLSLYASLLIKWQKGINLVSNKTLDDVWRRHFLDSAQLAPLIVKYSANNPICVDMGAGAGFPGLVLAAIGVGNWILVESDTRKCVFLNEVVRQCEISATIRNERLEGITDLQADIVTARAFAPLDKLLGYAETVMKPAGIGIFPKGQRSDVEIIAAKTAWDFEVRQQDSQTDEDGNILVIQKVRRV